MDEGFFKKVFFKRPFTQGNLQDQRCGRRRRASGALVRNSLLLSTYQRNPGGIYDTLSGF
jgi:hypothetical protein